MKKFAAGILLAAALLVAVPALSQGPALPPGEYDLEAGQYVFNVPDLAITDTPAAPTDTPVAPTETSVPPSVTPAPPTATPVGPIAPFAGAPLCPTHDNRAYHSLWDEIRGCHYNHEHGDDPHSVDDIFGTQFYTWSGGDISYPWETPNENQLKHEGYKWHVRRLNCSDPGQTEYGCVKAYRAVTHNISSQKGAEHRRHSFWAELYVCRPDGTECGFVRHGGHSDYGFLVVNGQHVPLAGDPAGTCCIASQTQRLHPSLASPTVNRWYGLGSGGTRHFVQFNLFLESWDNMDPGDPGELNLICPDFQCKYNASARSVVIKAFVIENVFVDSDGDQIGSVLAWTDRDGNVISDCGSLGPDCVPFEWTAPMNPDKNYTVFQFADPLYQAYEYDLFDEVGEWWIEYPN